MKTLSVLVQCLFKPTHLKSHLGGERGLVVRRWTCNPEVPGSNPPPCHWMDLSSVVPNSTPPRCVNSQLVSLPPVGILNLLCLICVCLLRAFEHIQIEFARYKCLLLLLSFYWLSISSIEFIYTRAIAPVLLHKIRKDQF